MATTTMTSTTEAQSDSKVVNTTLNYYLDPSKGGHTSYQIGVSDYYRRKFDPHPAQIHNIRGREDQFSLDTNVFQHVKNSSAEKDFDYDAQVKAVVYPEVEQLIKDMFVDPSFCPFMFSSPRDIFCRGLHARQTALPPTNNI